MFDLGGGARIRDIWSKYYDEAHGFIFVVDSSNESRMDECQTVLRNFLSNKHVQGKPVLVLVMLHINHFWAKRHYAFCLLS